MELARLDTSIDELAAVASVVAESSARVLVRCVGASTAVAAAWLSPALAAPVGVWLHVGEDYPAALAARDVATLSHLFELSDAVIEGATASSEAELVRALLTGDAVDFANDAGTLRAAFNRPAPRSPVAVWAVVAGDLVGPAGRLRVSGSRSTPAGTLTLYR